MADETPTQGAPESPDSGWTEGQPPDVGQAVATEEVSAQPAETPETPATETVSEEPASSVRRWADKYESPEQLEVGYRNTSAEATRLAQENAELRRQVGDKPETPQYTENQLEDWKRDYLLKASESQAAKVRSLADGNYEEARRYDHLGREAAQQIGLIDRELRKMESRGVQSQSQARNAENYLSERVMKVAESFRPQLQPGTKLYQEAVSITEAYKAMGYKETPALQASAVALAAQHLGLVPGKAAQTIRQDLTKNINQALKGGVTVGAGKGSAKSSGNQDFMAMSDAQFAKWKEDHGL